MADDTSTISSCGQHNEEFQNALAKVSEEFQILIAGKSEKSIPEAIELREYVRKRTDLEKDDAALTPEQKAWKHLFHIIDDELAKRMDPEAKSQLDTLRIQMDQIELVEKNTDELVVMGRQIEELLVLQRAHCDVHFGKNAYRESEEKMAASMLAASTPKQSRVEIAKSIIALVEKYKGLMLEPLLTKQNEIHALLTKFNTMYKQTPFFVANDEERVKRFEALVGRWLELTENLHGQRLKVITGIRNLVELDALIPGYVIKHEGDTTIGLPTEEFASMAAPGKVYVESGKSGEDAISEERNRISEDIFGKPESYINIAEEPSEDEQAGARVHPLEGKPWFRLVKVLYIIAWICVGLVSVGLISIGEKAVWIPIAIAAGMLYAVRKIFYYVVLGKTSW